MNVYQCNSLMRQKHCRAMYICIGQCQNIYICYYQHLLTAEICYKNIKYQQKITIVVELV